MSRRATLPLEARAREESTVRVRPSWAPRTYLEWAAVVAVVGAAATVVWQAFTTNMIDYADHCGFDGKSWCDMAQGRRGVPPFASRFLLSLVVRAMHFGGIVDRFFLVNLVSCALISIFTGLLTMRFGRALGAPVERLRAGAVIAGALTALSIYPWHFTFMVPVNVDVAAAALVLGWLLTLDRPVLNPALAAAAVMTRDATAPALAVAVVALLLVDRRRWPWAVRNVAAIGAASFLTLLVPATGPNNFGPFWYARATLKANFGSAQNISLYVLLLLRGIGFVGLLAIPTLRRMKDPLLAPAWGVVFTTGLVGTLWGGTIDRYTVVAMALLVALAAAHVASSEGLDGLFVGLAVLSVAVWRPWETVSGDFWLILRTYTPILMPWSIRRWNILTDLRNVAVGVVVAVPLAVLARRSIPRGRMPAAGRAVDVPAS